MVPKEKFNYNPIRRRSTGRSQLRWRANILTKRTEQTKHGLIYEDNEDEEQT
jgi:hypothetical protein